MKYARLFPFLLSGLLALGCGNATPAETDSSAQKPTNPMIDPNVVKQIPAQEVLGCKVERHLRYQPEAEVEGYVEKLSDVDSYLFNVSSALRTAIGGITPETPAYGTIVVGVNAQGQHRIWYVFPNGAPSEPLKAAVQKAVAAVPPLIVKKEVVTVGFAVSLWGYKESHEEAGRVILPQEWQDAGKAFSTPQKATKLAQLAWDRQGA